MNPGVCGMPNTSCTRGRRRSASTRATRWPAWASTTARLVAVVVLPSPAIELVTWTTLIGAVEPEELQVGPQPAVGLDGVVCRVR